MSTKILNCVRADEISKTDINLSALTDYQSKSKNIVNLENCWFDTVDEVFFGTVEDYDNTESYDCLYLKQREQYLNDSRHGLPYFIDVVNGGYNCDGLIVNHEMICEETNFTKNVNEKSIFIIGAGPSVDFVDIVEISKQYDQIWVCNDYRKHSIIKNITPDLFYLSNEVYVQHETIEFLIKNKDIVCAMDINVTRSPTSMNIIKQVNKDNNFIFSLRSFTSSGVMPRLITLASLLGAKEVGFVGLDGYSEEHYQEGTYVSSFEGGTKKIANSNFNYRSQCREFILFWDYVVNIVDKKTKFVNYGNCYEHNISKHILDFIERG
jgi:hypothetical protein